MMMKELTLLLSVSLCRMLHALECNVTISELQLSHDNNNNEFIELKKHCPAPIDLSKVTLVLWRSVKDHGDAPADLLSIANFTKANCTKMLKTFLVIGPQHLNPAPSTEDSVFCPFETFPEWKSDQHIWIPKGNGRTFALVVYENLAASQLTIGLPLTEATAYRENIIDITFHHKQGSDHGIKDLLFPNYLVGPSTTNGNNFFRLPANRTKENKADASNTTGLSFGFCCTDGQAQKKWPLAFRVSEATPGRENECKNSTNALDPHYKFFTEDFDRCNVTLIESYHGNATEPSTPTSLPPAFTTEIPKKNSNKTGIVIGILVTILAISAIVIYAMTRKRRHQPVVSERTCLHMNCFRISDDQEPILR